MIELDFYNLVRRMRDAQKRYFRDRRHSDLEESKQLEKAVDKIIKGYFDKQTKLDL